ncbi:MAG: 3-hydroxyacyl-CoA dehydrogenase family protein [Candidatus Marinimicrobia bacterium]|nr:3-hydroxyacyl-CoA dehydrogenase family protein [Candidatus Neomarinimicrobiota bacterium]
MASKYQKSENNLESNIQSDFEPSIGKVGVLGSGLMGHGIACVSALAGIEVILVDTTKEQAEFGFSKIKQILQKRVDKKTLTEKDFNTILSRIFTTSNYEDLSSCELIIEAVFENKDLKRQVTIKAESVMKTDTIFASNTSTIPITELAKNSNQPRQFIGLHFFSPVDRMKLVEIIKGKKTSKRTLSKAYNYVLSLKKTPIIVNDGRGFYTTRVFERYTCEGMALLEEGVSPKRIEEIGKKAGYPIGPLAILDEITISLAYHIREQVREPLSSKSEPWDKVMEIMISDLNRTGKSKNGGFYEYPKDAKKYLWPQLKNYFTISKEELDEQEIIDRFYFSQVIETIRCFEERIITSVSDANIGSMLGWGFPRQKGGTLQFVNDYGLLLFQKRAQELMNKYGSRFSPPKLLDEMIKSNSTF